MRRPPTVITVPERTRRALCRQIEGEIRCLDNSYTYICDGIIHDREIIRERKRYVWLLQQLGGPKLAANTYTPAHLRKSA